MVSDFCSRSGFPDPLSLIYDHTTPATPSTHGRPGTQDAILAEPQDKRTRSPVRRVDRDTVAASGRAWCSVSAGLLDHQTRAQPRGSSTQVRPSNMTISVCANMVALHNGGACIPNASGVLLRPRVLEPWRPSPSSNFILWTARRGAPCERSGTRRCRRRPPARWRAPSRFDRMLRHEERAERPRKVMTCTVPWSAAYQIWA